MTPNRLSYPGPLAELWVWLSTFTYMSLPLPITESLCLFLDPLEPFCPSPNQVQVPWEQVFVPFDPTWYHAWSLMQVDAQEINNTEIWKKTKIVI